MFHLRGASTRGRRASFRPMQAQPIETIAHTIQLAVAPVFLLTGISALLGVFATRLARIVDRARKLEVDHPGAAGEEARLMHEELDALAARARMVNVAISLAVGSAILVCSVIVLLFASSLVTTPLSGLVPVLFIVAMLALISALAIFLREILVATATLRIGPKPA